MQRILMDKLVKWKENPDKKPLILQGVRQSGKTYLLKEFGSQHYEDVFYCKFDEDMRLVERIITDMPDKSLTPQHLLKKQVVSSARITKLKTKILTPKS